MVGVGWAHRRPSRRQLQRMFTIKQGHINNTTVYTNFNMYSSRKQWLYKRRTCWNGCNATVDKQTSISWVQCNRSPRVGEPRRSRIPGHVPDDKTTFMPNYRKQIIKLQTPSVSDGRKVGSTSSHIELRRPVAALTIFRDQFNLVHVTMLQICRCSRHVGRDQWSKGDRSRVRIIF